MRGMCGARGGVIIRRSVSRFFLINSKTARAWLIWTCPGLPNRWIEGSIADMRGILGESERGNKDAGRRIRGKLGGGRSVVFGIKGTAMTWAGRGVVRADLPLGAGGK